MKLRCYVREDGKVPFLEYVEKYKIEESDSDAEGNGLTLPHQTNMVSYQNLVVSLNVVLLM